MRPTQLALAALGIFVATVLVTLAVLHLSDKTSPRGIAAAASPASLTFSYGPLGKPNWSDTDHADISRRSPEANLAEFRSWIQHPLMGTAQTIVRQDEIDEFDNRQRALFYEVAKHAPQLLAQSDVKALRDAEEDLYESSCSGRDAGDVTAPYKLSWQQCAPYEKKLADLRNKPEFPGHPDWCQFHLDAAGDAVFDTYCPPKVVADRRAYEASSKHVRDFMATGSANATAEWQSVSRPDISCGIAPSDRYVIVHNEIGSTKYDEPSDDDWAQLGCRDTEPSKQQQLIDAAQEQAAKKYMFEHSHHIDPNCVLKRVDTVIKGVAGSKDDCWRPGSDDISISGNLTAWRACADQKIGDARDSGNADPTDAELASACGPQPQ